MRVAILHNAVAEDAGPEERDVLAQVAAVREALTSLRHDVHTLACTLNLEELRAKLARLCPAVVFNLVESLGGSDRLMTAVPLVLEALHIPYTGAAGEALALANHKLLAKQLLRAYGIATPEFVTDVNLRRQTGMFDPRFAEKGSGLINEKSPDPFVPGPYIVKAMFEHASFGLVDDSVRECRTREELGEHLRAQRAWLGRPALAERYIAGREFNLSLLAGEPGPQVLPPAEIVFDGYPAGKPRLVGHAAKWQEDSFEYAHTPRSFDFSAADGPLLVRLREIALKCWYVFGMAGYARVDFRVSEAGEPYVLEVNANPCLSPDAGFAAALNRAGIPFTEAVCEIMHAALTNE